MRVMLDAQLLKICARSLSQPENIVEKIINLRIEKLPEGVYLATSKDLPGLVVQGGSIAETLESARDAARQLSEVHQEWARP